MGALVADLATLADVTTVAYETGGGMPGAGFDKARLVVNGRMEDVILRAPALARVDDGLVTMFPVKTGSTAAASPGGKPTELAYVVERYMAMPGRTAARAGTLKLGLLAIGIDRADTNVGRPLRQFLAELFMASEDGPEQRVPSR